MGARENGRDIHNRAAITEMGGGRSGHIPWCAEQVHGGIEHGLICLSRAHLHIGKGDIPQRIFGARGACVVDQDIELAKGADGARNNLTTHLWVGTITDNRGDVVSVKALFCQLFDKTVELGLVATGHGHFGTLAE